MPDPAGASMSKANEWHSFLHSINSAAGSLAISFGGVTRTVKGPGKPAPRIETYIPEMLECLKGDSRVSA